MTDRKSCTFRESLGVPISLSQTIQYHATYFLNRLSLQLILNLACHQDRLTLSYHITLTKIIASFFSTHTASRLLYAVRLLADEGHVTLSTGPDLHAREHDRWVFGEIYISPDEQVEH